MPIARLDGIKIRYRVDGQGDPLVMIMGFSAGRIGWTPQVPSFRNHYRVVTFDNRGTGRSDKPPGPYSTRMMADDTVRLLDFLEIDRAHILGLSMGGMIAQELAIGHPDRVMKLVLACTYAAQDETSGITMEQFGLWQLAPEKKVKALIELAFNSRLYRLTFSFLAAIGGRLMGAPGGAGISGQSEACRQHNTLERLHLITAPTLVIVGTADKVIKPVSSEVIAGRIPGARLVQVEGGSHCFSLENRNVFNREVLDFLRSDAPITPELDTTHT